MNALRPFDPWAFKRLPAALTGHSTALRAALSIVQKPPIQNTALEAPQSAEPWTRDDWVAFWEERAGIREFESGVARKEAEAGAVEDCIAQWLAVTPLSVHDRGNCISCGEPAQPIEALPIIIAGETGLLHPACAIAFSAQRRMEAQSSLGQFLEGVQP